MKWLLLIGGAVAVVYLVTRSRRAPVLVGQTIVRQTAGPVSEARSGRGHF